MSTSVYSILLKVKESSDFLVYFVTIATIESPWLPRHNLLVYWCGSKFRLLGGFPRRRLSVWTMADEVTRVVCRMYVGAHSVIQTMGGEAYLYVV